MSRLTRVGTAEPVSRDQILRHVRGQGNINFPCSADHEQDWQPYPAEPVSRDQILRHVRGQGNINFPCSADHEQDWQPYPVDPYSAIIYRYAMTIHTTYIPGTYYPSLANVSDGDLSLHTSLRLDDVTCAMVLLMHGGACMCSSCFPTWKKNKNTHALLLYRRRSPHAANICYPSHPAIGGVLW